jgi:hypothetical protein
VIMALFMLGLILGISYFVFKLFRIYTNPVKYQFTIRYLTFFGESQLALHVGDEYRILTNALPANL